MSVFASNARYDEPDPVYDGSWGRSDIALAAVPDSEAPTLLEQLHARMLTSEQLDELPPPVPLIGGVLWRDTLVELWGKPGTGKSFIAIDWALCVATGKAWHGHMVTGGRVLYIVGEGVSGIGKRRRAWSNAWEQADTRDVTWLRGAVPLMHAGWVEALEQAVAELAPDLVVVDTLSRSISGSNENAPETMSQVVASADKIRAAAAGACVLFVHHATKAGDSTRGHSALEGACDVRWKVEKNGATLRLSNPKSKDDAEAPDQALALRPIDLGTRDQHGHPVTSCVVDSHHPRASRDEATGSEAALFTVARDSYGTTGATSAALREASVLPKSSFYRALNALAERGDLINRGNTKRPRWHQATPDREMTR